MPSSGIFRSSGPQSKNQIKRKALQILDFARELRKTVEHDDALVMIAKSLEKKGLEELEIRGRIVTIQTTALLKLARVLRRVLEICGDLLSPRLQRKTTS